MSDATDDLTAGPEQPVLQRTRTQGLWVAALSFAVVLLLLAVFILQNSQKVEVSYLGADGHLSLAVAMLLSAVAGALLVGIAGFARVLQLRHVARRERKARG
ncbi:MAG: hypothetical protein JWO22_3064 [Frankiales bacterium]|nr:hypothetical protein [Frankiales bacterium]